VLSNVAAEAMHVRKVLPCWMNCDQVGWKVNQRHFTLNHRFKIRFATCKMHFFDNEWNVVGTVILAMVLVFIVVGSWVAAKSTKKLRECSVCADTGGAEKCQQCRGCQSNVFIGRFLIGVALGLGLLAYIVFYQPYVEDYEEI